MPPSAPSSLPSPVEATPLPWIQEGFPAHVPHPLPTPFAVDLSGVCDPEPRCRMGIAWQLDRSEDTPPARVEVRIDFREGWDTLRAAWLAEIADLVTGWIEDGEKVRWHTLSFRDPATRDGARHLLLGVESLAGEGLWAHPSAAQAGLLPFPVPPSQQATILGEPPPPWATGPVALDRNDPRSGLPRWHPLLAECVEAKTPECAQRGLRILELRAAHLARSGPRPSPAQALRRAAEEVETALRIILGVEHLSWPAKGRLLDRLRRF